MRHAGSSTRWSGSRPECKAARAARLDASTWASPARPASNRSFPRIISAHRERYPGVLVSPEERNTPLLVAGLRSGEIDVAFIRPPLSDGEGLEVEPLVEEPMVILLPE